MAGLISSPSPSPYINGQQSLRSNQTASGAELVRIELGVLIIIILVFGQFVLGCRRRRVHDTWQGGCILLLYTLISAGIPYLLSLMRSSHIRLKLIPIWGYFLVYAYEGTDTMIACNFSDNDRSLAFYFRLLPLLYGTGNLIGLNLAKFDIKIMVPLIALYIFTVSNTMDTMLAYFLASKSTGLPEITSSIENYMRSNFNKSNDEETDDPVSYLVQESVPLERPITTVEVWKCEGQLLNPSTGNDEDHGYNLYSTDKRSGLLKDTCLSYAFFNILLMRFAGYSLAETSRPKSVKFVQEELLRDEMRAFRISEMELEFLFDLFDVVIKAAGDTFKGMVNMEQRCEELEKVGKNNIEDGGGCDVLKMAAVLATHLRTEVLDKPDRMEGSG